MEDLTETAVEELVRRIEDARAGQVSLYGLFCLLDALEPVPAELERARRKREEGVQVAGALRTLLDAEAVLGSAPTEMKRTLAEDMDRAAQVEGMTAREKQRASEFIDSQLKAAAKDNSDKGALRRTKLKEKRMQVETCPTVGESKDVQRLEKNVQAQKKEFAGAREQYEMWQAGRVKFSSNTELQATKRRYETLKKQVSSAEAELEAALCRRRPPGSATLAAGTWSAGAAAGGAPAAAAKAEPNGKAPVAAPASRAKAKAAPAFAPQARAQASRAVEEEEVEGEGGQHWPSLAGGPKAFAAAPPVASPKPAAGKAKAKAKAAPAFAEEDDGEPWQRRARAAPDTAELDRKREAQREKKNAAKRRGQELMAELGAELRGEPEPAPVAGNRQVPSQQAPEQPRQGWSAMPKQMRAELEAKRAAAAAPVPARFEDLVEEEEEAAEEDTLAEGWESVWSEEHSSYYYWNTTTNETQWEPPLRPRQPARPPPPPVPAEDFTAEAPQPASSSSAAAGAKKKKKGGGAKAAEPEEAYRPSAEEVREAMRRQATSEAIARARRDAHGGVLPPAGGFGGAEEEEEQGPRLSYECVLSAVAAELGLSAAQVRDLGVSSVGEWRANFSAEEWGRVRTRAVALESAKKAQQQKAEKDRSARLLARIAEGHGAPATSAASQRKPAAAPKAAAVAAGRGAGGGAAAGRGRGAGVAGPGPPQGKKGKKQPTQPVAAGLDAMAHRNRFANFGDSSDSDD